MRWKTARSTCQSIGKRWPRLWRRDWTNHGLRMTPEKNASAESVPGTNAMTERTDLANLEIQDSRCVLVTGGAGFIGSHLVERLLGEGKRVVVMDDCSTGSLENLQTVLGHERLRVIVSRVSAFPELPSRVAQAESIYHLAAAVVVGIVEEFS